MLDWVAWLMIGIQVVFDFTSIGLGSGKNYDCLSFGTSAVGGLLNAFWTWNQALYDTSITKYIFAVAGSISTGLPIVERFFRCWLTLDSFGDSEEFNYPAFYSVF